MALRTLLSYKRRMETPRILQAAEGISAQLRGHLTFFLPFLKVAWRPKPHDPGNRLENVKAERYSLAASSYHRDVMQVSRSGIRRITTFEPR